MTSWENNGKYHKHSCTSTYVKQTCHRTWYLNSFFGFFHRKPCGHVNPPSKKTSDSPPSRKSWMDTTSTKQRVLLCVVPLFSCLNQLTLLFLYLGCPGKAVCYREGCRSSSYHRHVTPFSFSKARKGESV